MIFFVDHGSNVKFSFDEKKEWDENKGTYALHFTILHPWSNLDMMVLKLNFQIKF